jgi:hypothetical protein
MNRSKPDTKMSYLGLRPLTDYQKETNDTTIEEEEADTIAITVATVEIGNITQGDVEANVKLVLG